MAVRTERTGASTARAPSTVISRPKTSTTPPTTIVATGSRSMSEAPARVRIAATTSATTGAPVPTYQKMTMRERMLMPRRLSLGRASIRARAAIGRIANSVSR